MGGQGFEDYDASYRSLKGGKGDLPGSALKEEGGAAAPPKPEKVSASQREIARQVDDLFYKRDGYKAIDCACGTTLKIPPDFKSHAAKCPRCGTLHKIA